jgi:hypothetical protein
MKELENINATRPHEVTASTCLIGQDAQDGKFRKRKRRPEGRLII